MLNPLNKFSANYGYDNNRDLISKNNYLVGSSEYVINYTKLLNIRI